MKKQFVNLEDFGLHVDALSALECGEVNGGGTFAHWIGDVLQWFSENSPPNTIGVPVYA